MAKVMRLPNTRTAQEFAEIIRGKWQDNVKSILDTARWVETAHGELGPAAWLTMVRVDLKWSRSMGYKLLAIADDHKIDEVEHVPLLPATWGTIHALTLLTDEQFQTGINTGVIHPGMERKDLKQLKPLKEKPEKLASKPSSAIPPKDACVMEVRRRVYETIQQLPPEELTAFFADIEAELNDLKAKALGGI